MDVCSNLEDTIFLFKYQSGFYKNLRED